MFESLKKKLLGFLGKEEKKKPKKESKSKKTSKEPVPKKTKRESKKKVEVKQAYEEPQQEIEPEKPQGGFFSRLASGWGTATLTKEQFDTFFTELEIILLENNVALETVDAIRATLEKKVIGAELKKGELEKHIMKSLKESIAETLHEAHNLLDTIAHKKGTFTILFFGINGSGKTTSVAKVAHYLKKNKISSVMAAGDTFRAASIEQLETHGARLNVPVIKQVYGADPAAVAFDAKKYAEKNHIKVILIDTAGRMYTRNNLMKEMEKIVRVSEPDLKLFVGESITGNDATEQARMFNEVAGIDGIILTKADVDDKGGTALSVSQITGKPIYFLGTGQEYDDFKSFKKEDILKHLGLD